MFLFKGFRDQRAQKTPPEEIEVGPVTSSCKYWECCNVAIVLMLFLYIGMCGIIYFLF